MFYLYLNFFLYWAFSGFPVSDPAKFQRTAKVPKRSIAYIPFPGLWRGYLFFWYIGVSLVMSKRKHALPFACASICRVIYGNIYIIYRESNIWQHPCSPLYLYFYIYLVGRPEAFNSLLHLMSFMALDYCLCNAIDLNIPVFISASWKHLLSPLSHAGSLVFIQVSERQED